MNDFLVFLDLIISRFFILRFIHYKYSISTIVFLLTFVYNFKLKKVCMLIKNSSFLVLKEHFQTKEGKKMTHNELG